MKDHDNVYDHFKKWKEIIGKQQEEINKEDEWTYFDGYWFKNIYPIKIGK